jgi:putative membrane protein
MRLPPFDIHLDAIALVVVVEAAYLAALTYLAPRGGANGDVAVARTEAPASRAQMLSFTAGVLSLGLVTSWPVHDLAEHYLLSVHMVQHMVISLVAPPLLIFGTPPWLLRRIVGVFPLGWIVRNLARPFFALVLFNAVIVLTHWPLVVDLILRHHALHFWAHLVLFSSATLMWWPVVDPLPEMPGLSYPGRMLYLFLQSIVPTVPASFLTFGSSPLYHFYAEAPRIWPLSVLTDQRIAGLVMKLVGGAILWLVIAVTFFKWFAQEHRSEGWDALEWHRVGRQLRSGLGNR